MLPDHPQLSPHSRGNLFDNTEIEEALLLHVHTLSDAEREAIADQDPAVREMVERAAATTPRGPDGPPRGDAPVRADRRRREPPARAARS